MSATPVGDYLAKRYPPNDGAAHWMGSGDDPGCCGGAHPACLYYAAQMEALRMFADRLDQVWRACSSETAAKEMAANVMDPTMKEAASMARSYAKGEFRWPPP